MKGDVIVGEFFENIIAKMNEDKNIMPLVTIYKNPTDYPEKFVARLGFMRKGKFEKTNSVIVGHSLAFIKQQMPLYMHFMDRQENDDPKIVGVYL